MRDYRKQAKESLKVYLDRGEKALNLLREGMVDEANVILRWRNAAFMNFRAAEAILAQQDDSKVAMSYLMDYWQHIAEQNAKLEPLIVHHLEQTKQKMQVTQNKRKAIAQFRSGNNATGMLRSQV